jgi:membrane protease YdiL (CAAX protease family)
MTLVILMATALVAYAITMNLWPPFNGPAYVPLNLVVVGWFLAIAFLELDLTDEELGFRGSADGALLSGGIALGIGLVLLVAALPRRTASMIRDERVADLRGRSLAYQVFIRIPIGTAAVEEILFRGVLFAAFQDAGLTVVEAALASSAAFGLWHISSTANLVRINDPEASRGDVARIVFGGVVLMTLAGLGLTWLRVETHGLLAPFIVHTGVNSLATLASVIAARRLARA